MLGLVQQINHPAHGRLAADSLHQNLELTELVDRPREDPVSGADVHRQALARQDRLIDRCTPRCTSPSAAIRSPGRTSSTSPGATASTGPRFPGRPGADGPSAADTPGASGLPLRPIDGQGFQALAHQSDEDDLRSHEVLSGQPGRNTGHRQRDIGADPSFKQGQKCKIDDPPPADERRNQRQANAEGPVPRSLPED